MLDFQVSVVVRDVRGLKIPIKLFVADSGLPVYNDIADIDAYHRLGLDYQDLCDPDWFQDDHELAVGFWGDCVNLYRNATEHAGYGILQKWKDRCCQRTDPTELEKTFQQLRKDDIHNKTILGDDPAPPFRPFFIYSSNVDGHFHRRFEPDEIYEIHGNVEWWQCAGRDSKRRPCNLKCWPIPPEMRFDIDPTTRNALDVSHASLSCPKCKAVARPNVLMFRDKAWIRNTIQEVRMLVLFIIVRTNNMRRNVMRDGKLS